MKHTLKQLTLALAVLLVSSGCLHAQATLASTTLSAALTGTDSSTTPGASTDVIYLTSVAGFVQNSVGQYTTLLYVDFEAMDVVAVLNSTTGRVRVVRGAWGTQASAHLNGATVYVGPPSYFGGAGGGGAYGSDKHGACTATAELVLPFINISNGNMFHCIASQWRLINTIPQTVACTATVSWNSSTTLSNVTGMVVTVVPGTYRFYVNAPGIATANTGIKMAFKLTTAVLTSIEYTARAFTASGVVVTHGTTTTDQTLWMDSAAGVVISTVIEGTVVVGTGGTIQFQGAQHTSHADTASVYVGSSMTFTRIF
jgi:hypothetical protein